LLIYGYKRAMRALNAVRAFMFAWAFKIVKRKSPRMRQILRHLNCNSNAVLLGGVECRAELWICGVHRPTLNHSLKGTFAFRAIARAIAESHYW
jgi:hypothetical protein